MARSGSVEKIKHFSTSHAFVSYKQTVCERLIKTAETRNVLRVFFSLTVFCCVAVIKRLLYRDTKLSSLLYICGHYFTAICRNGDLFGVVKWLFLVHNSKFDPSFKYAYYFYYWSNLLECLIRVQHDLLAPPRCCEVSPVNRTTSQMGFFAAPCLGRLWLGEKYSECLCSFWGKVRVT